MKEPIKGKTMPQHLTNKKRKGITMRNSSIHLDLCLLFNGYNFKFFYDY